MRDTKTEQQLERGKFAYRFQPNFLISKIDLVTSEANPARLSRKIDEERCAEMALAMEQGVDFPAIILIEEPKLFLVATGMHRLKAATEYAKPVKTIFDAYIVIETDPYRRDLLIRSINCIEGKGQTRNENLQHCADMHRLYGGPIEDLAAAFNLRPSTIKAYLRYLKVDDRAKSFGVEDLLRSLAIKVRSAIAQIKYDSLFVNTIRVLVATKASVAVAMQIAQEVAGVRSEKAGQKILEEREEEFIRQEASAQARYGRRKPDIPTKAMVPVRRIINIAAQYGNDPAKLQWGALDVAQSRRDLQAARDAGEIIAGWVREISIVIKQHEKKAATWKQSSTGEQPSAPSSPSE
jgi:cell division protein ZapA (FtsZ GTPase activity inhibitor)